MQEIGACAKYIEFRFSHLPKFDRAMLFEGESHNQSRPPGLKSLLISLNLQMDWLLYKIQEIQWSYKDPILWASGLTEMERLTLLLEDRRFFLHSGFDYRCVPRVIKQIVLLRRVGGVSTIEQQLVRTILSRRERTIRRKSREILLAWILSHRKTKRETLRTYLATAYLGYKLRGCDDCSRLLFGKESTLLGAHQAAMMRQHVGVPTS